MLGFQGPRLVVAPALKSLILSPKWTPAGNRKQAEVRTEQLLDGQS